jgi:hypothetical protein
MLAGKILLPEVRRLARYLEGMAGKLSIAQLFWEILAASA